MNFPTKSKLDTGAMVFATTNCTRYQYRIIANLTRQINVPVLQEAVNKVIPRYPSFNVEIINKWNSIRELRHKNMTVSVQPFEAQQKPFDIFSGQPLFRIMYGDKLICVEIFHILSDANGGLAFLNSILACYFELLGENVDKTNIIDYNTLPEKEEFEDGFFKYAKKEKSQINKLSSILHKNFKIKDKPFDKRYGVATTYSFDAKNLKQTAKNYGATVHEYLTAILYLCFLRMRDERKNKKCIRIQMPINLRKKYNCTTLKNFVATTQFTAKSTEKTAIIKEIQSHLKQVTSPKELDAFLWQAVSLMTNLLRFIPRRLGDFLMITGDKLMAEKNSNTSFSNIGVNNVNLHINGVKSFEFVLGFPLYAPFLVSSLTFNNTCNIVFSRHIPDDMFEKYFSEELGKDGLIPFSTVVRQ